jgi:hypothetical protein
MQSSDTVQMKIDTCLALHWINDNLRGHGMPRKTAWVTAALGLNG